MADKQEVLEKIVQETAAEAGVELFDLAVKMYRGTANVEILVDLTNGGISVDQCAKINRKINASIEEDGLYGEDYTVSVCSPGLDWPLKTEKDFRRLVGYDLDVRFTADDPDQIIQQNGSLQSVGPKEIILKIPDGEVCILLEHIRKAVVMI